MRCPLVVTIAAAGAVPALTGCRESSSNMAEGTSAGQIPAASADRTAARQTHRPAITGAVDSDPAKGAINGRMGDTPALPSPSRARAA